MARRRNEAFITSKTHDRTRDGSLRLLEESLRLMNTDHLDLWQLHNVQRMEEIERIFAPGGALEALTKARDERMVRFLGITGHFDPGPLMEGIRRFPFDTVLMALNAADRHQHSFAEALLPLAVVAGAMASGTQVFSMYHQYQQFLSYSVTYGGSGIINWRAVNAQAGQLQMDFETTEKPHGAGACPECGGAMYQEEGCLVCRDCAYSQCS
jgi:hypothetical protein